MKHIFFALLLAAVSLTSCQKSLEDKAADDAREYTSRECPRLIADNIMQDSMVFERSTKTLIYYYTLQGTLDNSAEQQRHKDEYIRQLRQGVKSTPSLTSYVKAGFKFRYVYRSERNGETILDLSI